MKNHDHDPQRLLALFKQSKKTVQKFVDQFTAQNNRKPRGDDLATAPEYVKVCIKNCKRIKAHLSKEENMSPPKIDPKPENSSQISQPKTDEKPKKSEEKPKISPPKIQSKSEGNIWGAHLNRSFSDITNNSSSKGNFFNFSKATSYTGTLSALVLEDLSKSTRKSLKGEKKSRKSSKSFFDTMGDESTLQGLIDASETTMGNTNMEAPLTTSTMGGTIDPLVRFHPELSMDGLSQHGKDVNYEDCEIGQVGGTQPLKAVNHAKKEGTSLSVLTSVTSKNQPQYAKERSFMTEEVPISFSGLFPKSSSLEIDDETEIIENNDEIDNPLKRKSSEFEQDDESSSSCNKKSKLSSAEEDCFSDEDMFADENIATNNVETPHDDDYKEGELLPLSRKTDKESDKEDRRKAKKPKKHNGLVTSNFVKIDLKKKVYVRGQKHMTGAKYKRMEWKRKVQAKFGRKSR
jgi:hypothetical protein